MNSFTPAPVTPRKREEPYRDSLDSEYDDPRDEKEYGTESREKKMKKVDTANPFSTFEQQTRTRKQYLVVLSEESSYCNHSGGRKICCTIILSCKYPPFHWNSSDSESYEDGEDDFEEVEKQVIMSEVILHPSGMRNGIEEKTI